MDLPRPLDSILKYIIPVDGKLMAKAAHSAKMDVEMVVNAADESFQNF